MQHLRRGISQPHCLNISRDNKRITGDMTGDGRIQGVHETAAEHFRQTGNSLQLRQHGLQPLLNFLFCFHSFSFLTKNNHAAQKKHLLNGKKTIVIALPGTVYNKSEKEKRVPEKLFPQKPKAKPEDSVQKSDANPQLTNHGQNGKISATRNKFTC
jgi:hypothetical protein